MYETILFDSSDGIATITLNRPDVLNAYVPEMGDEIVDAFARIRADDAIRVVILTGAGRAFCAGVDLQRLKQSQAGPEGSKGATTRLGEEAFINDFPLELATFPKPVIAALNGAAVGVGITMVLPCDIRIAVQGAKLGLTFTKLGILPGLGSTHLLPAIVGRAKALELVLTSRVIKAEEGEQIGLVNKVVSADMLMEEARTMATMMTGNDPDALSYAKGTLGYGASVSLADAVRNEQKQAVALREAKYQRTEKGQSS